MSLEFKLPELGENITSADVIKVLISVGDKVEVEQPVLEIETEKATIEVPSSIAGNVSEVLVKDGDNIKIGQLIFKTSGTEAAKPEVKAEPKKIKAETVPVETKSAAVKTSGGTVEFKLPDLGENISSAEITKVLVKAGDTISEGQNVIEVESEKAALEVPCDYAGVVKTVKVKEGDKVSSGDVILVIESTSVKVEAPKTVSAQQVPPQAVNPKPPVFVNHIPEAPPVKREVIKFKVVPAAPSVRRFAREIGIMIEDVTGTGPGKRITVEDVKKYSKRKNELTDKNLGGNASLGIVPQKLPDFTKWGDVEVKKMSNVRKKTAEHLSYAWASIPHVTQFDKADITELEQLRKQFGKLAEKVGGKLTITAILLKVLASAFKKFPQFNSSVDMQNHEIIYKNYVNIGIAVDTDRGLIVPVIRDVDKKNIVQLAKDLTDISVKARNNKITLEDMQGGNFTISNLGGIGGTSFTPIVNTPEVAILGVSRGAMEPVYKDGNFVPRLKLPLSLSYDHRVIDGADGARFIRWVCEALENPLLLVLEG
ncbi:MAG: dihydrolipoyllysine-residue acetyltransferase [Melioribacteraceae bacterium]|nr:dihydrolipoyllysine-residue acetyltransferase [Melioribacteraceae bacterium]